MSNQEKVETILDLLARQGRSVAWLSKGVGTSRQAVTAWLTQRAEPRDPEILDRMIKVLQPTPVDRPRIPVGFAPMQIPFAGSVPCSSAWGDPLAADEFVEVDAEFVHSQRFAARVVGDSCFPSLQPGDLTIWHADMSPPYGLIVLAQRKGDHGCTVKRLDYDMEKGRPYLSPVNPSHSNPEDGDGWGVIARLVVVLRTTDGLRRTWYLESGLRPGHLQ